MEVKLDVVQCVRAAAFEFTVMNWKEKAHAINSVTSEKIVASEKCILQ